MSQRILIIGATSAIAGAVGRKYAALNEHLFLVARHPDRLAAVAADLATRGAASVGTFVLDVTDTARHQAMADAALAALGAIDVALIAHGVLPDQRACEASVDLTLESIAVNGTSVIALMTLLAPCLEQQKSGILVVISSVAGDRGRQSNYVYGTAKGMVNVFAQGLRNRLFKSGVHVLTIKPGFVDTPMTAGFSKGFLWATPERVACDIVKAIDRRKSEVYVPFFWRQLMIPVRLMPEWLFKRLSL